MTTMTPPPTGRVTRIAPGRFTLTLTRSFAAPIDDVWSGLTDPERTARWFGPWRGEPGAGRTIEVRMSFEEGADWMPMRVDTCEPPQLLAVAATDDYGSWILGLRLAESAGVTGLTFVQQLSDTGAVENVGPGWEYYLDMLVAAQDAALPRPDFEDYYPAQEKYYQEQQQAAEANESQ